MDLSEGSVVLALPPFSAILLQVAMRAVFCLQEASELSKSSSQCRFRTTSRMIPAMILCLRALLCQAFLKTSNTHSSRISDPFQSALIMTQLPFLSRPKKSAAIPSRHLLWQSLSQHQQRRDRMAKNHLLQSQEYSKWQLALSPRPNLSLAILSLKQRLTGLLSETLHLLWLRTLQSQQLLCQVPKSSQQSNLLCLFSTTRLLPVPIRLVMSLQDALQMDKST